MSLAGLLAWCPLQCWISDFAAVFEHVFNLPWTHWLFTYNAFQALVCTESSGRDVDESVFYRGFFSWCHREQSQSGSPLIQPWRKHACCVIDPLVPRWRKRRKREKQTTSFTIARALHHFMAAHRAQPGRYKSNFCNTKTYETSRPLPRLSWKINEKHVRKYENPEKQ